MERKTGTNLFIVIGKLRPREERSAVKSHPPCRKKKNQIPQIKYQLDAASDCVMIVAFVNHVITH